MEFECFVTAVILLRSIAVYFVSSILLCKYFVRKEKKFTDREYFQIYPSDPIPLRLYGTIKTHKPEKNYPMRTIVSTIGTPAYGITKYLVEIIQPTLNKNNNKIQSSTSFVYEAKDWKIEPTEIQVSCNVINHQFR